MEEFPRFLIVEKESDIVLKGVEMVGESIDNTGGGPEACYVFRQLGFLPRWINIS